MSEDKNLISDEVKISRIKNRFKEVKITETAKYDPEMHYYILFDSCGLIFNFISSPFPFETIELEPNTFGYEFPKEKMTEKIYNTLVKLIIGKEHYQVLFDGENIHVYKLNLLGNGTKLKIRDLKVGDTLELGIYSTKRSGFVGNPIIVKSILDYGDSFTIDNQVTKSIEITDSEEFTKENPHKCILKFNKPGEYLFKVTQNLPYINYRKLKSYFEINVTE